MSNKKPEPAGGNWMGKLEASAIQAGRVLSHPFTGLTTAVTGSITAGLTDKVQKFSTEEIADIKKFVLEGHWSWKVLGFLAGVAMTLSGAWMLLFDILGLNVFMVVVDVYVLAYGVLCVCLEYKEGLLPDNVRQTLQQEFLFVYKPYGRSFLYVLFGLLLFSQGSIVYMLVGPFTFGVGIMVGWFSQQAENEFKKMKQHTRLDDTHLRSLFNKYDEGGFFNRDGKLNSKEFAKLYQELLELGGPPNYNELEIALLECDTEHNGFIDFPELKKWYNKKLDEA
jgi:hypothetical protein